MMSYRKNEEDEWPTEELVATYLTPGEAQCHQLNHSLIYPGGHEYIFIDEVKLRSINTPLTLTNLYTFDSTTGILNGIRYKVAIHSEDKDSIDELREQLISFYADTEEEAQMKFNQYKEILNEQ